MVCSRARSPVASLTGVSHQSAWNPYACESCMQAVHIDEALERAERFADIGADILFIDALESAEELRRFANELRGVAGGVPKMASMLEGGGKTPLLTQRELARMNFKLVAYPLSLLGVSVRAMQSALGVRASSTCMHGVVGTFRDELSRVSTLGSRLQRECSGCYHTRTIGVWILGILDLISSECRQLQQVATHTCAFDRCTEATCCPVVPAGPTPPISMPVLLLFTETRDRQLAAMRS